MPQVERARKIKRRRNKHNQVKGLRERLNRGARHQGARPLDCEAEEESARVHPSLKK